MQGFQAIAWRDAKIINFLCRIDGKKFGPRTALDLVRNVPNRRDGSRTGPVVFPRLLGLGRCMGGDRLDLVELLADLAFGDFHIVTVLEIHPELCGGTEGLAETQRGIGGDPGRFRRDALDARTGQVTSLRERTSGQIEREKKFFSQNFAGMHGSKFFGHFRHSYCW
jgi:hypothetical protein